MNRFSALFCRGLVGLLAMGISSLAEPIPGLFNTGVDNNDTILLEGSEDPHWALVSSAEPAFPGPQAFVVLDNVFPIPPWIENGPDSKWIAPMANQSSGIAAGNYHYRTSFNLTGFEPSTAVVSGHWTSDNSGPDVLLNGASTGVTSDGNYVGLGNPFTISNGFVDGINTLEFVVNNAGTGVNSTGVRIELSGTADVVEETVPSIVEQPADTTVALGGAFRLDVVAIGGRPFFYQWRLDGIPLVEATNSVFSGAEAYESDTGSYDVIIMNSFGAVTSLVAKVDLRMMPSSRRTGVVFSEIMYHPSDRPDGLNGEFVELHNSNPWPEDISGWQISGEVDHTFAPGTVLAAYAYLVVAPAPADMEAIHGITGVEGSGTNQMSNASGRLRLRKKSGATILDCTYSDENPWPVAADGTGHSLFLAAPSYGEANPRAWAASSFKGGTPGGGDSLAVGPLENVVINEVLTHTDEPQIDAIELYNHGVAPVDISGCFLSDAANTNKFQIPEGTTLAGGAFVSFDQNQLGFALSAMGETIYFVNPLNSRVIEALKFGGQANGVSMGRSPDGAPVFSELSAPTLGSVNAPALTRDVVINEIMYNPISGDSNDEYVELYNRGSLAVDIGGWQLMDGISYTFPDGTTIPAGSFLVVAENALQLATHYPGLNAGNLLGDYSGKLANGGERIALGMQDSLVAMVEGVMVTNHFHIVVDEVDYADGGQWGRWADGGGSSLELIDARSDNRLGPNWADSDESAKSDWVTVEKTDVMNLSHPDVSDAINQLHLFLLGAGEALVDDVEFIYDGVDRIQNSGFETGLGYCFFQGTQRLSYLETTEGFSGSQSLHLVATARGGVANRVRQNLTDSIPEGSTATIQAKVRWLRGHPEIVFRAVGSSIEAVGILPVPANLGTPGAVNSRSTANVGPSITEVTHRPVLPAAGEAIRVTARVQDVDGLTNVLLRYRIDPGATVLSISMKDDGTGGDLVAGDGLFSGMIPGQGAGVLVAFHVQSSDGLATTLFPSDAPVRECLVRVGEAPLGGDFGTYRMWMTQATFNFWANRENSSNEDVDTTFVYGTDRVIYNVGSHYGVSDNYSTILDHPMGVPVGYNLDFPADEPFLGVNSIRLDWPVRDPTIQREHLMYWFLEQYKLPNNYRRYINFYINGVRRQGNHSNLYEDAQRPNGDMLEEWYPSDPDGDLFKTDGWFEASKAGQFDLTTSLKPRLKSYTDSVGKKKLAYYRFNWKPRSINRTANDYSKIFSMVDAANITGPAYESTLATVVDVENWMRTFAMNDLASFWDSFGNPNSKNAYVYKPEHSGWKIMSWDFDVGLGVYYDPPDAPLFGAIYDEAIDRMNNTPAFVRHYWRAMDEAVYGFFNAASVTPFLSDRYAAFQRNGNGAVSPFVPSGRGNPVLSVTEWITQRRNFIIGELAAVDSVFSVDGPDWIVTSQNEVTLTGTASVRAKTVTVNAIPYAVTWNTVNSWSMNVSVSFGTNVLVITALDGEGVALPGAVRTITVESTGSTPAPEDFVFINEWMADNSGSVLDPADQDADDWFELYNSGTEYADLSGFALTDDPSQPEKFTIPAGWGIEPNGFLLIWADDESSQTTTNGDLHVNFKLSASGEVIELRTPIGALVDSVLFGAQSTDVSEGRFPSGAATPFFDMPNFTPGSSNWIRKQPVLAPLVVDINSGFITVVWSSELGITYRVQYKNNLTDLVWVDLPGDVVASGATAMKTDSSTLGIPHRFYRVLIGSRPVLGPLVLDIDSSFVTVVWTSEPGIIYRVQYKNNLGDSTWSDLSGYVVAPGKTSMKTDTTVLGVSQRFYRVELD